MKHLAIFVLLLCIGCASHPAKPWTGEYRTIRVAVLNDGSHEDADVDNAIRDASSALQEAGIKLEIVKRFKWKFQQIEIDTENYNKELADLNRAYVYFDKSMLTDEYDIAVAFRQPYAVDGLKFAVMFFTGLPIFNPVLGITDDTYRRYILMMSTDHHVLTHEISHTLLAEHDCMRGIAIQFMGIDKGLGCIDRMRDFNKTVNKGKDVIAARGEK